jgi:hypothetical protein
MSIFFRPIWDGKTLLDNAWLVPSVMPGGAYHPGPSPPHFSPTLDPGAPGWTLEPRIKTISEQYLNEHRLPLWNPYSVYGTPFAAAMQPQLLFADNSSFAASHSVDLKPLCHRSAVFGRVADLFLRPALSRLRAISAFCVPHVTVEVLPPGMLLALVKRASAERASGTWSPL